MKNSISLFLIGVFAFSFLAFPLCAGTGSKGKKKSRNPFSEVNREIYDIKKSLEKANEQNKAELEGMLKKAEEKKAQILEKIKGSL
jgi:hypothetical protein